MISFVALEEESLKFPVIILGAGPAGATASMQLTNFGIRHLVLEKSRFPRDKICGDALSGKVVNIIKNISPDLELPFRNDSETRLPSFGVTFVSPNGRAVDVPFKLDENFNVHPVPSGYISKRIHFDHFLARQIPSAHGILKEDCSAVAVDVLPDRVEVSSGDGVVYQAELVIDCSGTAGLTRKFTGIKKENDHHSGGVRAYYKGVKDLHPQGYIELHFLKDILPGYLWIFPLPDGEANVGLGMLTADISKGKVNLRRFLPELLSNHPVLKERFEGAEQTGEIQGWGLPLGSKVRQLSGHRIMACGDAAALIDPFTGEGIANAMDSGRIAAEIAHKSLNINRFDGEFLSKYDGEVYKRMGTELKLSYRLQKLVRYPFLFNFITRKAAKNKEFRKLLTSMFDNVNLRDEFRKPSFYFKILFR